MCNSFVCFLSKICSNVVTVVPKCSSSLMVGCLASRTLMGVF